MPTLEFCKLTERGWGKSWIRETRSELKYHDKQFRAYSLSLSPRPMSLLYLPCFLFNIFLFTFILSSHFLFVFIYLFLHSTPFFTLVYHESTALLQTLNFVFPHLHFVMEHTQNLLPKSASSRNLSFPFLTSITPFLGRACQFFLRK